MRFLPELPLYVIFWTGASIATVISVLNFSRSLRHNILFKEHLEPGWLQLGGLRWWFCGHLICSLSLKTLRITTSSIFIRKLFIVIYGMMYVHSTLGDLCLSLMLVGVVNMFVVVKMSKTSIPMWTYSFAWIILVQGFLNSRFSLTDYYQKSLQFASLAYTILRSIYFGKYILVNNNNAKGGEKYMKNTNHEILIELLDCLTYAFYMPLLTFGQLAVFEEFKRQMSDVCTINKAFLLRRGLKIIVWTLFYEVLMHFCYPFALLYEETLLWSISLWTLAGTAYLITQLFTVKYVVLWSYTSLVAGFDGIYTPKLPECTSHCHNSSAIWRTFDNGLYEFIKRNVYVTMGGSRNGIRKQFVACFFSFLFLCIWHGLNARIALWCVTSYTSVVLEVLVSHMFSKHHSQLSTQFSEDAITRIKYIFTTFNLTLFLCGTLLFLGDTNLCSAMYYRLFIEGFPVSLLIYLSCKYSGLQAGRAWKEFKMSENAPKV